MNPIRAIIHSKDASFSNPAAMNLARPFLESRDWNPPGQESWNPHLGQDLESIRAIIHESNPCYNP